MRGHALLLITSLLFCGCDLATSGSSPGATSEARAQDTPARAHTPAGGTCGGRTDCGAEQVCVDGTCRFRKTSVHAEVMVAAALAQATAGDPNGAFRSYEAAFAVYEAGDIPIPPDVACGAARNAMRDVEGDDARERAASFADRCFRNSLPGDPIRREVLEGLSKLRYDGLALASFDAPESPDAFFTDEPSRPTVDAVEIELGVPDRDVGGYRQVIERLESEDAVRAIADCFIQAWELRHERQESASLVLSFRTRLRDMGDYDVYVGTIELNQNGLEQEGFEPCVSQSLLSVLEPAPRLSRNVSWQEPVSIEASLR